MRTQTRPFAVGIAIVLATLVVACGSDDTPRIPVVPTAPAEVLITGLPQREGRREPLRSRPITEATRPVKQLVAPFHLAIFRILDLHPGRAATVALIGAFRPLGDDALEVALAGQLEESLAAGGYGIQQ